MKLLEDYYSLLFIINYYSLLIIIHVQQQNNYKVDLRYVGI